MMGRKESNQTNKNHKIPVKLSILYANSSYLACLGSVQETRGTCSRVQTSLTSYQNQSTNEWRHSLLYICAICIFIIGPLESENATPCSLNECGTGFANRKIIYGFVVHVI